MRRGQVEGSPVGTDRWKVHNLRWGAGYDRQTKVVQKALQEYGYAYVEDARGFWRITQGEGRKVWAPCDPPGPLEKERQLRRGEERIGGKDR